jgi:hypothetical protein
MYEYMIAPLRAKYIFGTYIKQEEKLMREIQELRIGLLDIEKYAHDYPHTHNNNTRLNKSIELVIQRLGVWTAFSTYRHETSLVASKKFRLALYKNASFRTAIIHFTNRLKLLQTEISQFNGACLGYFDHENWFQVQTCLIEVAELDASLKIIARVWESYQELILGIIHMHSIDE